MGVQNKVPMTVRIPDVITHLRMTGEFQQATKEVLARQLTMEAAEAERISVSEEEVQEAADDFRTLHGLNKAGDFRNWLEDSLLDLEAFEAHMRTSLIVHRFKEHLMSICDLSKYPRARLCADAIMQDALYGDWLALRIESKNPVEVPNANSRG